MNAVAVLWTVWVIFEATLASKAADERPRDTAAKYRLTGGSTPYEGNVEIFLSYQGWTPLCDEYWNTYRADEVCHGMGHSTGAMWSESVATPSRTAGPTCVSLQCAENTDSISLCTLDLKENCQCTQVQATCNYEGYVGCFKGAECDKIGELEDNQMTIQLCLENCRSKGLQFGSLQPTKCICRDSDTECQEWSEADNILCALSCGGDESHACGGRTVYFGKYDVQMGACGGSYSEERGTIYSHNFPGYYPDNSQCSWDVSTSDDHVSLDFTIFDIRGLSDQILITESYEGTEQLLAHVNSTFDPSHTIHSCSSKVNIELLSSSGGKFAVDFKGNARCIDPGNVDNGDTVTMSICPYRTGDIVTVVCDEGYRIRINSTSRSIECKDGEWNSSLPECEEVVILPGGVGAPSAGVIGGIVIAIIVVITIIVLLIILIIVKRRRSQDKKVDKRSRQTARQDVVRYTSVKTENESGDGKAPSETKAVEEQPLNPGESPGTSHVDEKPASPPYLNVPTPSAVSEGEDAEQTYANAGKDGQPSQPEARKKDTPPSSPASDQGGDDPHSSGSGFVDNLVYESSDAPEVAGSSSNSSDAKRIEDPQKSDDVVYEPTDEGANQSARASNLYSEAI
ncbi:scavenger receptor cysteine-rich domain superfamily protein-like [Ptychodera flava]|uniref:scavenger receptor cysteine-rich domain superfamily protein-like n=1 Tax=Ptychodera flava TaxID=63121 RepID=UPI00396AA08D